MAKIFNALLHHLHLNILSSARILGLQIVATAYSYAICIKTWFRTNKVMWKFVDVLKYLIPMSVLS